MRKQCRIWWPEHPSHTEHSSLPTFLFGWFISCTSDSLDIIVAFHCDESLVSRCQSSLKEILDDINRSIPVILQDKSMFSLLGQCAKYPSDNDQFFGIGVGDSDQRKNPTFGTSCALNNKGLNGNRNNRCHCGCHKLDGLFEKHRHTAIGSNRWIQMIYATHEMRGRNIHCIPTLHHIHWNEQLVYQCDVHVILYETPKYGTHHFSLDIWNSSKAAKTLLKKPKWIDELHQKQPPNDLDAVILAMNSATASKRVFQRHVASERHIAKFSMVFMLIAAVWKLFAVFVASISTLFFIFIQFLHGLLSFGSQSWMHITFKMIFHTAWINIQIRCGQILYWPILLKDNDLRTESSVDDAEKVALQKHSMWSSLAVDVLLGNFIGFSLFFHAEFVCLLVVDFATDTTNELLRTGCVWLMGVPAGFKLNTELAGVLGMVSLNAIQIWSTLWFFVDPLLLYLVKGLAILGILFGVTTTAALVRDMIVLVTLHVSGLHWMISLLYSQQIQALAALWRLFRGRKWNPLRQRLDSYEYTVKQHIAGSLIFTPLLLLLPTTSVFYIFFTMMYSSISLLCMLIEVLISVIHATPYIDIILWFVRRRRFPAGIWYELVSCHNSNIYCPEIVSLETISPAKISLDKENTSSRSHGRVSILHSNFLTIGQIVIPHYRKVFSNVSRSYFARSAYGVLTGKRISSTLGTKLPLTRPWMSMSYREYWYLCRNSILGCMPEFNCHLCQ